MNAVDQPLPIVVDEPAGNIPADADVLPVVLLGAPERKEIKSVMCGVGKMGSGRASGRARANAGVSMWPSPWLAALGIWAMVWLAVLKT